MNNSFRKDYRLIMGQEPTYENYVYYPHRSDGLDHNLRKLNKADWDNGFRCTCKAC